MDPTSDGVIKFRLEHLSAPLPAGTDIGAIRDWFGICRALDLIGQHAERYQGAAYGNISQRSRQGFLVTGTQTGAKPALRDTDLAWVRSCDVHANRVMSQGAAHPSSESLTHGQLYALHPEISFVIHVHSALIWRRSARLALPTTPPQALYGTPEMAEEVERLIRVKAVRERGVFSMGGHEDGIVAFGETPDEAGHRLLRIYREACELRS